MSSFRLRVDPINLNPGISLITTNGGNTPVRVDMAGRNCSTDLMFPVTGILASGGSTPTVAALFGQYDLRTGIAEAILNVA